MSLPNVHGCYHMPSGPEQVRLESLGAENIQGTCAYLSANMWGSSLEGGTEIRRLHLPVCNGVIPPEEKS